MPPTVFNTGKKPLKKQQGKNCWGKAISAEQSSSKELVGMLN